MKFILKNMKPEISVLGIANVHFFEFSEDFQTTPDSHPFYELVYVASGSIEIGSNGYDGVLERHHMILHSPDEVHSLTCGENGHPTVIIIGFVCKDNVLASVCGRPICLEKQEIQALAEIVREGRNVFCPPYDVPVYDMKLRKNMRFGSEQMLKNLIECFLIGVVRREKATDIRGHSQECRKISVGEVCVYLDKNCNEKITLDALAFLFGTNRSTLCREFREHTGKTIKEYTNVKRFEEATSLVAETDLNFTEISDRLNFESIHYFTRFFKRFSGIAPREYRKRKKQNKTAGHLLD